MIIEGAPAGNVGFWVKHLQRTDTNEAVHIRDVRGTLAQDLDGALYEMQAVASGSRSQGNFMYQANINPRADEHLTAEQWRQAIDTLEQNLGLEDHQRVVIEHVKEGRQHYHVIWNRVDVDTMRVRDMGGNFYTHERTARQLEEAFGLERTPRAHGDREGERTSKRTELWEYDRGHESGQSPREIKAELTTLWNAAPDGRSFVEAIEQYGYILTKGDRRDFCVIDRAGDEHSLARRLDGVTARELREHLAFVDRESLPTVAEAKELFAGRQAARARGAVPEPGAWSRDGSADMEWEDRLAAEAVRAAKAEDAEAREQRTSREKLWKAHEADNEALRDNETWREAKNDAYQQDRQETQDQARADRMDAWEARAEESREQAQGTETSAAADATGRAAPASIKVFDAAANMVAGLADFVADILTAFVAPPTPKRTVLEDTLRDPGERVSEIEARRRADAALGRMAEDLKHGNYVKAEDIRLLTPSDLQNIRDTGDAGLLDMIRRLEEERARERDSGGGGRQR